MRLLLALVFAAATPAFGQFKNATPAGEAPGPWQCGTIGVGKQADGSITTTALKGIAIKVGAHGEAAVAYDLDLCRMAGAWTGKFVTPMNLMSRGEYPTAMGEVAFTTAEVPGFAMGAAAAKLGEKISPRERAPSKEDAPLGPEAGPLAKGYHPTRAGNDFRAPGNDFHAPGNDFRAPKNDFHAPKNDSYAPKNDSTAPKNDSRAAKNHAFTLEKAIATPAPLRAAPSSRDTPSSLNPTGHPPKALGWADPRPEPFGPLPAGQAKFQGFYVNGEKVILKWDVGGVEVLEMPGYEMRDGVASLSVISRSAPTKWQSRLTFYRIRHGQRQHLAGLVTRSDVPSESVQAILFIGMVEILRRPRSPAVTGLSCASRNRQDRRVLKFRLEDRRKRSKRTPTSRGSSCRRERLDSRTVPSRKERLPQGNSWTLQGIPICPS